jgi:hypothetical protein
MTQTGPDRDSTFWGAVWFCLGHSQTIVWVCLVVLNVSASAIQMLPANASSLASAQPSKTSGLLAESLTIPSAYSRSCARPDRCGRSLLKKLNALPKRS